MVKRLARQALFAVLPEPVWRAVRWEFLMSCLRWQNRRLPWRRRAYERFRGRRDLLIQLGSGPVRLPGWINLDGSVSTHPDLLGDLHAQLPFDTGSVKAIFAEHCLEHLHPYAETQGLLAECHRVLQSGGRLRIVVPDGEQYCRAYVTGDRALFEYRVNQWAAPNERGEPFSTMMELFNEVCRQKGEHRFLYDFETLALWLRRAGFSAIERSAVGASPMPELRVDQAARAPESLYVEAVR